MKLLPNLFHPRETFKPVPEVTRFLIVAGLFAVGFGCFNAVMNNFLVDRAGMDPNAATLQRGVVEFFRELPGLLLIVILALLAKRDEWWILRFSFGISALGMVGLILLPASLWNYTFLNIPAEMVAITFLIVMWSLGEHILMPVRNSIAMHIAKPGEEGGSLGFIAGLGSLGTVAGSLIAMCVFLALRQFPSLPDNGKTTGYNIVFGIVALLLVIGIFIALRVRRHEHVRRPHLYFHKKYNKFYILEIFYGARKQVFMTFAPMMLIFIYGMDPARMALLFSICSGANIFGGPVAGWIIDRLGYRTVMIWDTVILIAVCLLYGFAHELFSFEIAFWVVCTTFILDALITNASMATNIYVRDISDSREEFTATLSTGISVNHLISILIALLGGLIGKVYGYGTLFTISACMALGNTLFALTLPKRRPNRVNS